MTTRILRSFLTFRLRTLLVVVAGICALLAWRVHQVRSRELALEALRSSDSRVVYEDESDEGVGFSQVALRDMLWSINSGRSIYWSDWRTDELNSSWSRRMRVFAFGDYNKVYGVGLGGYEDSNPTAAQINLALERLPAISEIRYLDLDRVQASESALHSIGRLKNLERLYLVGTQASDKTIQQIGGLTMLQWLAIGSPNVTAHGLEGLQPLHNLLWLELDECTFGDDGVDSLQHFTGLRQLALPTTVTDVAAQRLRELLPDCNVVRGDPRQLNSRGIPVGGIF